VAPAPVIPLKSIAVLPFASLSEDKANEYFASGIQDEILTRLAKIAELKVISRTSTQQYQSKPGNLPEIAKQLGVAHILEGSVQKVGDAVRINVQLIKAEGDSHLWADTYDRKLTDIFAVESEVAQKIADSLKAKLSGSEEKELARVPTENSEAYDAYLRGLALDNAQSEEEGERARQFFRRAVELDPQFALAWAYLANREAFEYFLNRRTPEQLALAQKAMETALRLQPELSESHAAAGSFYYYCRQDFDRALTEFKRARELSPNNANAITMAGLVKRRQGKLDESIQLQLEATILDPRNPDIWVNIARSHRGARRFKEAHAMFDRALAILPGDDSLVAEKSESYLGEGDLEGADKLLQGMKFSLSSRAFGQYIQLLVLRREFDRAIAAISEQLNEQADSAEGNFARLERAFLQAGAGNFAAANPVFEEARRQMEARRKQGDQSLDVTDILIEILAALGDRNAMEGEAKALLQSTARDLWRLPQSEEVVARGYAILGDANAAIPHIERALATPSQRGLTPAYLRLHPVWDKIRSEPRFQKLAETKP